MLRFIAVSLALGFAALSAPLAAAQPPPDEAAPYRADYLRAMEAKDPYAALAAARSALERARGDRVSGDVLSVVAYDYAAALRDTGELRDAVNAFQRAARFADDRGGSGVQGPRALLAAARVEQRREYWAGAFNRARDARELVDEVVEDQGGYPAGLADTAARIELMFAEFAMADDRVRPALNAAEDALAVLDQFGGDADLRARLARKAGAAAILLDEDERALDHLAEAYVLAEDQGATAITLAAIEAWTDNAIKRIGRTRALELRTASSAAGLGAARYDCLYDPERQCVRRASQMTCPGTFEPAKLERRIEPFFPQFWDDRIAAGFAVLRYELDDTGELMTIEIIDYEPHPAFGAAAVDALERWRFTPARCDGKPVAIQDGVAFFDFEEIRDPSTASDNRWGMEL